MPGQRQQSTKLDADRVVRLRLLLRGYSGPPHSLAFTSSTLSVCLSWFSVLPLINLSRSQSARLRCWCLYLEVGHCAVELLFATSTPDLDSVLRM